MLDTEDPIKEKTYELNTTGVLISIPHATTQDKTLYHLVSIFCIKVQIKYETPDISLTSLEHFPFLQDPISLCRIYKDSKNLSK